MIPAGKLGLSPVRLDKVAVTVTLRVCEFFRTTWYDGPPSPSIPRCFVQIDGIGGPSYQKDHNLSA